MMEANLNNVLSIQEEDVRAISLTIPRNPRHFERFEGWSNSVQESQTLCCAKTVAQTFPGA